MIEFPVVALKEIGAAAEVELSYWQSLFAGPEHARIVDAGVVAVVLNAALEHGLVRLPVGDDTPDYNKGQGLDQYYIGWAQGQAAKHRYPEAKQPQTYGGEPERANDNGLVMSEPGEDLDDDLSGIADGDWCDLVGDEDEPAETQADLIHDLKQSSGQALTDYGKLDREPLPSARSAMVLGPEHTINTPLRPIGPGALRARLPDPDVARGRLAHAIAAGSDETRELVSLATRKPRTLAEVDAKGRRGWNGNELPTIQDMVAELKRQSMAGMMPSQSQFNDAKPANWAVATAQLQRLNTSWDELANLAGLKRRQPGPVAQPQAA